MITIVQNIFREIQPDGFSLSIARRHVAVNETRFNGELVTSMMQEVEVKEGSTFQVGKLNNWVREGKQWIKLVSLQQDTEYHAPLEDHQETGQSIDLRVRLANENLLMVGAKGYGEKTAQDGKGFPIVIEYHDGEFKLLVWSDINEEEPTHVIPLEGAREDARKKPVYYECGICDHCHPWDWNGDCRDDANRLTCNQLIDQHGQGGYELRSAFPSKPEAAWINRGDGWMNK